MSLTRGVHMVFRSDSPLIFLTSIKAAWVYGFAWLSSDDRTSVSCNTLYVVNAQQLNKWIDNLVFYGIKWRAQNQNTLLQAFSILTHYSSEFCNVGTITIFHIVQLSNWITKRQELIWAHSREVSGAGRYTQTLALVYALDLRCFSVLAKGRGSSHCVWPEASYMSSDTGSPLQSVFWAHMSSLLAHAFPVYTQKSAIPSLRCHKPSLI